MTMKYTGLTLIELIVTLAVVSVLLAYGVPQFKGTTANSRLTSAINTLTGDFAFARTEAIKRGVSIKITAANAADWATGGWAVAINTSGGDNLRISPALGAGATIATNPANTGVVSFNADGRSPASVTFTLCDDRTGVNTGKRVTLNTTGQTFLDVKQGC